MSLFDKYIINPVSAGLKKESQGIPIPLYKLSRYTNYIDKGTITAIGGKPSSGKTGLMDYAYFISVFKEWRESIYELDEKGQIVFEQGVPVSNGHARKPLKMFYFSMKTDIRIKLQKWLCLYLKLEYGILMDIPTLTSGVGQLYELTEDHVEMIQAAKKFFDEFEDQVLTLVNGRQTPSSIYNRVNDYMKSIGHVDQTGTYMLNRENEGQTTIMYVDNDEYMLSENDGHHKMNDGDLKIRLSSHFETLKRTYGVTSFVITPSKLSNSRMVKDSEPTYKEIGVYAKVADIGLVTYNPYNENNNKFLNYPVEDLIIRGVNRFRTVTIVRNYNGQANITVGLIFQGECGFFVESSAPNDFEFFEVAAKNLAKLAYVSLD